MERRLRVVSVSFAQTRQKKRAAYSGALAWQAKHRPSVAVSVRFLGRTPIQVRTLAGSALHLPSQVTRAWPRAELAHRRRDFLHAGTTHQSTTNTRFYKGLRGISPLRFHRRGASPSRLSKSNVKFGLVLEALAVYVSRCGAGPRQSPDLLGLARPRDRPNGPFPCGIGPF